jgi:hypothetical protein
MNRNGVGTCTARLFDISEFDSSSFAIILLVYHNDSYE